MTDRLELAKAAMQGLISSEGGIKKLREATNILIAEGYPCEGTEVIAMVSFEIADKMLEYQAKLVKRENDKREKRKVKLPLIVQSTES